MTGLKNEPWHNGVKKIILHRTCINYFKKEIILLISAHYRNVVLV